MKSIFFVDQVLFLPTTNWLTNISSNAFDDVFVSQFVVGIKRT